MGGLFFDFEAIRTESSDRDAPRRSREAVETLRRENAQLLTEVQRLKERHVTPKSSRRPKTPVPIQCLH